GIGVIGFEQATAMTLGEVIGTFAFAAIGAIGGTVAAKRTVFFYGIISFVSVACVLLFFPFYLSLVSHVTPGFSGNSPLLDTVAKAAGQPSIHAVTARSVANSYTIFSIFIAVVFLPMIGLFARTAGKILPVKGDVDVDLAPRYLDYRVVNTPTLAFLQAGNELKRMAQVTCSMLSDTVEQFYGYNAKRSSLIKQKENLLDVLQKELSSFLVHIAHQAPASEKSVDIPVFLSTVNDLEVIGDNCEIILDCLRRKKEGAVFFSDTAMDELKSLAKQASYLMNLAVDSLISFDVPNAEAMRELRQELLDSGGALKSNHLVRLSNGACSVIAGLLFMDIVSAFTKIGDYAFTIIETQRTLQ
nr:PhoU domain-containing protein [Geobacteraceae bacterium]